jgi:hypothetical protein
MSTLDDDTRPTKDECLDRLTEGLIAANEALDAFYPDAEAAARAAGARTPTEIAEKAARIRDAWGLPVKQSA